MLMTVKHLIASVVKAFIAVVTVDYFYKLIPALPPALNSFIFFTVIILLVDPLMHFFTVSKNFFSRLVFLALVLYIVILLLPLIFKGFILTRELLATALIWSILVSFVNNLLIYLK